MGSCSEPMRLFVLKTLWGREGKKPWERGLRTSPLKSRDIESRGEVQHKSKNVPPKANKKFVRLNSCQANSTNNVVTYRPRSLISSPDVYSELRKREVNTRRRWTVHEAYRSSRRNFVFWFQFDFWHIN